MIGKSEQLQFTAASWTLGVGEAIVQGLRGSRKKRPGSPPSQGKVCRERDGQRARKICEVDEALGIPSVFEKSSRKS